MKQIIGSAGSGKSFVLADKVAEKLSEDKSVVVMCYEGKKELLKKVNFFLEKRGYKEGDTVKLLRVVQVPTTSISTTSGYIMEAVSEDIVFVDMPIISNINTDRPYWASIGAYLNVMRAVAEFAQCELWMSLQSNRDTMTHKTMSILVVDEEDSSKHQVITLETIQDWVGGYSKSVYSK